jgi:hypothetical protein
MAGSRQTAEELRLRSPPARKCVKWRLHLPRAVSLVFALLDWLRQKRRFPLGWERTEPIETIARSNYGYIAVLLRLQNRLQ